MFILTFKAFVDHTAPIYLSELVKKKSSSTNTRSANDDLLLVIPSRVGRWHLPVVFATGIYR